MVRGDGTRTDKVQRTLIEYHLLSITMTTTTRRLWRRRRGHSLPIIVNGEGFGHDSPAPCICISYAYMNEICGHDQSVISRPRPRAVTIIISSSGRWWWTSSGRANERNEAERDPMDRWLPRTDHLVTPILLCLCVVVVVVAYIFLPTWSARAIDKDNHDVGTNQIHSPI